MTANTSRVATLANYGIDGPVVLRNLVIIGIGAVTFDLVVSSKALHNIINPAERNKAVCEIARVVKPGGWIGIIDSFQYARILQDIGWVRVQASARRFHMFPPVKWTTGIKPVV